MKKKEMSLRLSDITRGVLIKPKVIRNDHYRRKRRMRLSYNKTKCSGIPKTGIDNLYQNTMLCILHVKKTCQVYGIL